VFLQTCFCGLVSADQVFTDNCFGRQQLPRRTLPVDDCAAYGL